MKRVRWISLVCLAACAASNPPSGGSQTHFLRACDASCPAPYACLCGVCSLACGTDATCSGIESSECLALADAPNQCPDAMQICDVDCSGDGDCAALGSDFACDSGRCRTETGSGNAGASANAGSGASAGTGGNGVSGTGASGRGGAGASGAGSLDGGTADGGTADELCDGSDDVRLGVTAGGGFVESSYQFTNPYGRSFLFVDGKCRYYASTDYMTGISTGTLTPAEAEQLAGDIGWSRIEAWSSYEDIQCPDAGATQIRRPGSVATCICGCADMGPAGLADAMMQANDWMQRLSMQGSSAADGVSAIAGELEPVSPVTLSWPLARAPTEIPGFVTDLFVSPFPQGIRFQDPTEVEQLRDLRADAREEQQFVGNIRVLADGQTYAVYVRDDLPASVDASITALIASSTP